MPDLSTRHPSSSDILVLKENAEGEDFLIGDLHGCCDLLKLAISKLGKKDRLFIAGDLVDRGPQSYELIETIMKMNMACQNEGLPPRIHVARGNHEELFLQYCDSKRTQNQALADLAAAKKFYEQSLKQLDNEKELSPYDAPKLTPNYQQTLTAYNQLNQSLENYKIKRTGYDKLTAYLIQLGGLWTTSLDDQKLALLENYFATLPYLIHVNGKDPFNVVHADLPISNSELQARIQAEKLTLNAEERHYTIWARENDLELPIKNKKTEPKDPITYCGHTIGGGLRSESRHINLDLGAFFSSCLCLVGHKNKTCELLGDTKNLNTELGVNNMTPEELKNQIKEYFKNTPIFT